MEPDLLHCADTSRGTEISSSGINTEQVRLSCRPVKKLEMAGETVIVTAIGGTSAAA